MSVPLLIVMAHVVPATTVAITNVRVEIGDGSALDDILERVMKR